MLQSSVNSLHTTTKALAGQLAKLADTHRVDHDKIENQLAKLADTHRADHDKLAEAQRAGLEGMGKQLSLIAIELASLTATKQK